MSSSIENLIRGTVTKGIMKVAEFNRSRLAEPETPHPFLTGVHTPMDREWTLDQLRVTGKQRDDLQAAMALLRKAGLDRPLQFKNFRD